MSPVRCSRGFVVRAPIRGETKVKGYGLFVETYAVTAGNYLQCSSIAVRTIGNEAGKLTGEEREYRCNTPE
jgi:hypothetical protein